MPFTLTLATTSVSPAYWPREPTLMPCDPLHTRFETTMLVELGLNDTQSSPLFITESWIVTKFDRYISHPSVWIKINTFKNKKQAACLTTVCCRVHAITLCRDSYVLECDVLALVDEAVPKRTRNNADAFNENICRIPNCERYGPSKSSRAAAC